MTRDREYAVQERYCTIADATCYNEAKCSDCDLADEYEEENIR